MTVVDREPETHVVHTMCTLDCPDACSLAVTVQAGRITNIDAAPENAFTDGWICSKVKRHAQRVYAPERVMTPLIRAGAKGSGSPRRLALIANQLSLTYDIHAMPVDRLLKLLPAQS